MKSKLAQKALAVLKWLTSKLEPHAPAPPPKPTVIIRRHRPRKKPLCDVMDKVMMTEAQAKEKAKVKTNKYQYLRAYKCQFCPSWHLTHHRNS